MSESGSATVAVILDRARPRSQRAGALARWHPNLYVKTRQLLIEARRREDYAEGLRPRNSTIAAGCNGAGRASIITSGPIVTFQAG